MSALTLLQSKGVMSAPPSAPPPAIRQQSTSQPTHHAADSQSLLEACCRSPQRGLRYPDVRQPAPQSATHSGWSERGRCALPDASSPLPSSPASGPHRSSPGYRDSVRLRRPQTLHPPPEAEDRRLMPPLLRTGQFAPLTRRTSLVSIIENAIYYSYICDIGKTQFNTICYETRCFLPFYSG